MTENLRTIYFDESGYTGYDLLNSDQPIFSVASSDIDDGEAHAILRDSFPNYQGAEFKFSRLWKPPETSPASSRILRAPSTGRQPHFRLQLR